MRHLSNHPPNGRGILAIDNLIEPLESKALYNESVFTGSADRTAKILDLQWCACRVYGFLFGCHRLQFLGLSAAQFGNFARLLQPFQAIKGSLDYIMRIGAAK